MFLSSHGSVVVLRSYVWGLMMPKPHGENKLFTTYDAHGNDALPLAVFTSHTQITFYRKR